VLWSALAASPAAASYCDALFAQLAQIQTDESAVDQEFPLTRDAYVSSHIDIDNITNENDFDAAVLSHPDAIAKCAILGKDSDGRLWCDVYVARKHVLVQQRLAVGALLRQNGCNY
jgi:hypothetical protein